MWWFCNSLYDEQPHVLDVDADERAGGRRVHEGPERGEERLLDAVLVGPAHAGVEGEEGAEDVPQLGVVLRHGVVPRQEEPREQLPRDHRADHEELAHALDDLRPDLDVGVVEEARQDHHHRVAALGPNSIGHILA